MAVAGYVLLGCAVLALVICVAGVVREPRRLSNAFWLGTAIVFSGLWLLTRALELGGVAPYLLMAAGGLVALIALMLPGALIFNGVLMVRREGRRPANLLSLMTGIGMVTLAVLFFVPLGVWGSALVFSLILAGGYLGFLFTSLLVYSFLYSRFGRRRGADAIIVLGSGLLGDQVPPLLAARLDRGLRLYQRETEAGHTPVMVVSGGQGPDEAVSEAEAMRGYLLDAGLPAERVLLEDRAETTEQNLRYSMEVIAGAGKTGRAVAVTNNYHVFRTAVFARRLGLPVNVLGAPTALYFLPSAFLREFAALLVHYRRINLFTCGVLIALPLVLTLVLTLVR